MIKIEDLLPLITKEVVIEIMDENGSPLNNITVDGKTQQEILWFKTICHNGHSHKLAYYTESKTFNCYTNCGFMSFFDCVKKILGLTDDQFYDCVKYVAEKVGYKTHNNRIGFQDNITNKEVREIFANLSKKSERKQKFHKVNQTLKVYDEHILNYFDKNTFYSGWIQEGIDIDVMQNFGISWYEYQKHIIIPHYNINGELVGIRRRSLKPEDSKNKYMPAYVAGDSYEHSLSGNLYGIYENQNAIRRKKKVILVEGEKSVLLSNTYYGMDNSITLATCGFNISQQQIRLLKELEVNTVYLAFDKDFDVTQKYLYEGEVLANFNHYINRLNLICERLVLKGFRVYLVLDRKELLSEKDSPFDKGKKTLEILLKDAKEKNINYEEKIMWS
ncbi:MAG: hypothetical protein IJG68_08320 [Bacilli bacterium]|nr:hypothetical protein [Bacilli bacterium]